MNQLAEWRHEPAEENYLLSMERARLHNNHGVAQLESGNYARALHDIRIAAQYLLSAGKSFKKMKIPGKAKEFSQNCRQAYIYISTHNAFISSNALLLDQSIEPMYSCVIETASVLLNMALCYHINSLVSNAVKMYKMAYKLSIQCHNDSRRHNIILMSLNNLGQIMHEMGEYEMSILYLKELTCKVVQLLQANEANAIVNDGQDYLINALILINLRNNCAAAA
jgi:tetratricopeptide (TPR) repeat protein